MEAGGPRRQTREINKRDRQTRETDRPEIDLGNRQSREKER